MEACVVGKAGQGDINEAMTLYVMSQVSVGYGGSSNIEPADDWIRKGSPALKSGHTLYGVANLSIVQEQREPNPVFLVKYQKWVPLPNENAGKVPVPAILQRSEEIDMTDRVSLKQDRGDWVIYSIDRQRSAPAPRH